MAASDFITINGVVYSVLPDNAAQGASDYAGAMKRAFDLTMRNMTRARKRTWNFLLLMTQAQWETFDSSTSLRQSVACQGQYAGLAGPNVACNVTSTTVGYERSGDTAFLRRVAVTLNES